VRTAIATLALVVVACGDRSPLPVTSSTDGGTTTIPASPCSVTDVTGAIPGVKISIHGDKCVLAVGEGATFTYTVTTDATVPPIMIQATGGCGSCRSYGDDPLAFTGWVISGTADNGQQQQYCLCDTGCCAPDVAQTVTLTPATRTAEIVWSGRNWYGPSDTGNKEAGYFPVGHYFVNVGFSGGAGGGVSAKLPIEIR
jgi:hypothetical protein